LTIAGKRPTPKKGKSPKTLPEVSENKPKENKIKTSFRKQGMTYAELLASPHLILNPYKKRG
jgi:hypothetical protein